MQTYNSIHRFIGSRLQWIKILCQNCEIGEGFEEFKCLRKHASIIIKSSQCIIWWRLVDQRKFIKKDDEWFKLNKKATYGMNNKQIDNQDCKLSWNHSCDTILKDASLILNHEGARSRESHVKTTLSNQCFTRRSIWRKFTLSSISDDQYYSRNNED